jgi:hypothetical protein
MYDGFLYVFPNSALKLRHHLQFSYDGRNNSYEDTSVEWTPCAHPKTNLQGATDKLIAAKCLDV